AHYLVAQGVRTGHFIGIYFERGADMIVALIACMKIGAIYVPLDPINPPDRLKVIIEDAQADFLITQEQLINNLPGDFKKVICLDREEAKIKVCATSNILKKISTDQSVYLNYTSGSTGNPKGVLIPHYAVVDHHLAIIKALKLTAAAKIFSVTSIAFDPSVQDFFLPLMIGAQVYVAKDEEKKDGFQLKAALKKVHPTLMQATPSTWRMLLMANWEGNKKLTILCGGEGLTKELSNKLFERSQRLYNIYGPTETTIWSTLKLLEGDRTLCKLESSYEPIGRPLENVQIYLLDNNLNPVPIGVAGEIYIGGVGVAPNGYFKREELNAEKFVDNPFKNTYGKKLYRSGDMARYLHNGDLEYLNRADTQVKIRGFRIEPGEIESAIGQFEGIRENVVIIREDQKDNKRLVAYCISDPGHTLDFNTLKKHLKKKLPEYMVPSAFVEMEKFPLTATMKINRNLLPLPEADGINKQKTYIAAQGKLEILLERIWADVLGMSIISRDDDFFELGGHSLIAVNMIATIEKQTGKKLPLASLLENATIQKLALLLADEHKINRTINSSLVPIKPRGNKTPIYLVHGAGLHVLMFQTLAANMDSEQPIYALQARGLNGEGAPFSRMEEIAAHYISEIEAQNPDGPYALAGYSFGGLIAFEMAKQLEAMGKQVEMLAMLDTIVHENITGQQHHKNYYQRLTTLGKKVLWNLSLLAKNPIPNIKYKSHVLKRRYHRWVGQNGNIAVKERDAVFGGKVDQANKQAFDNYCLSPYSGKIHLFRANSKRFYVDDFEYLGWRSFAQGGVEIHPVPGDHLTLFDPPHGQEFARILQKCLNEVGLKKLI
ncbi:MAG: amino acid adenylation domain-containing protein, partial [Saprospiraceae bacterium]